MYGVTVIPGISSSQLLWVWRSGSDNCDFYVVSTSVCLSVRKFKLAQGEADHLFISITEANVSNELCFMFLSPTLLHGVPQRM
jgi:hypothetical protein